MRFGFVNKEKIHHLLHHYTFHLLKWRVKKLSDNQLIIILSAILGFLTGIAAFLIKGAAHLIQFIIRSEFFENTDNILYIVFPAIGIILSVFIIKYIIKRPIEPGIPVVLHAISQTKGYMRVHHMFSSIITSAITVGFGGSVGLEGPTVATGAAYGSALGRFFHLNYKHRILIFGATSAAAMSAIFKAPLAGVVFALEVIMIDLTMYSVVPILVASLTGALTSYFLFGLGAIYPFEMKVSFLMEDLPYYILLGIVTGFTSAWFTKMSISLGNFFANIKKSRYRLLIGSLSLGILIYLFPFFYGEGYQVINSALHGNYDFLYKNNLFESLSSSQIVIFFLFLVSILLKVVVTSVTVGSGGVGGIFAPTLFTGANTGLFFTIIIGSLGLGTLSHENFALVGMGGMIAGVLHAPLTGIFLIGDLTGGYGLFVPLMIVATISFATARTFHKHSMYTYQLAGRGELMTHHKDENVLRMMKIQNLIETNFVKLKPDYSVSEIKQAFIKSERNLFPVVDDDDSFLGLISLPSFKSIILDEEKYKHITAQEIMEKPKVVVDVNDTMSEVAHRLQTNGLFNVVVLDGKKYVGFVSRANVFSSYRRIIRKFSDD